MCEWLSCVGVILFLTLHSSLLPHGHSSHICAGFFHHLLVAVYSAGQTPGRDKEIRQGYAREEGGGGGVTFQVHASVVFSVCCEILTEIYTTGMALKAK